MPAPSKTVVVLCPCCEATLKVDAATGAVITHEAKVKPHPVEDLNAAVSRLKDEASKRDERFRRSMDEQKNKQDILNRRFDELFQRAKDNPDIEPPVKGIDLD